MKLNSVGFQSPQQRQNNVAFSGRETRLRKFLQNNCPSESRLVFRHLEEVFTGKKSVEAAIVNSRGESLGVYGVKVNGNSGSARLTSAHNGRDKGKPSRNEWEAFTRLTNFLLRPDVKDKKAFRWES